MRFVHFVFQKVKKIFLVTFIFFSLIFFLNFIVGKFISDENILYKGSDNSALKINDLDLNEKKIIILKDCIKEMSDSFPSRRQCYAFAQGRNLQKYKFKELLSNCSRQYISYSVFSNPLCENPKKNKYKLTTSLLERFHPKVEYNSKNINLFYGSSTVFGTSLFDDETIPYNFSLLESIDSKNLGIGGYRSNQSLINLINYQDYKSVSRVFFIDGMVDVMQGCYKKNNYYDHVRFYNVKQTFESFGFSWEVNLFKKISTMGLINELFNRFFINNFVSVMKNNKTSDSKKIDKTFICDSDLTRASNVAHNILKMWKFASNHLEVNQISFYPIIQPTIYNFQTYDKEIFSWIYAKWNSGGRLGIKTLRHEEFKNERKKQIDAVYPILRKLLKTEKLCYLDPANDKNFTSKFKVKDLYIDDVHFSPYGSKIFAEYLQNNLNCEFKNYN